MYKNYFEREIAGYLHGYLKFLLICASIASVFVWDDPRSLAAFVIPLCVLDYLATREAKKKAETMSESADAALENAKAEIRQLQMEKYELERKISGMM